MLPQLVGGSAYAQEKVDYYRGDLCADAANEAHDLATTAVCGEIYGPDPVVLGEDPTYDPEAVDAYMVKNNYITSEETGSLSDEVKEFKETCMDSTDIPITEDGKGIDASEDGFGVCLDKDVKYKYFRQYLGYENDRQSKIDAADDKLGIGSSGAAGGGGADGGTITGDAKSLASQILQNKNISFYANSDGTAAKAAFEAVAKGDLASVPYKGITTTLSSALMLALLNTAKTYSFVIGSSTNGDHDQTSYHYTGSAVDINGINGQGPPLLPSGTHRDITRQFAEHIAKLLPSGGGIGQQDCLGALNLPAGIRYFNDSCDHLHVDAGTAP